MGNTDSGGAASTADKESGGTASAPDKKGSHDYLYKLILIGDSGTGKPQLVHQFAANIMNYRDTLFDNPNCGGQLGQRNRDEQEFIIVVLGDTLTQPSIGVDFKIRRVELDGKSIKLQIWDTAGQERFRTITTAYYRGTHGIMAVYDVTQPKSFDNVKHYFDDVNLHASEYVAKVLVGNWQDETISKQVSDTRAKEYADQLGIPFMEVNSKDGTNVEQAFMTLVAEVKKRIDSKTSTNNANK